MFLHFGRTLKEYLMTVSYFDLISCFSFTKTNGLFSRYINVYQFTILTPMYFGHLKWFSFSKCYSGKCVVRG